MQIKNLELFIPFKQSNGYCGPASVKMILEYYERMYNPENPRKFNELTLAKLMETSRNNGCPPWKIAEAINSIKSFNKSNIHCYNAEFYDGNGKGFENNLNALDNALLRNYIPIVNWTVDYQTEGHYSPCIRHSRKKICLADPNSGKFYDIGEKLFSKLWFDYFPEIPNSSEDFYVGGMIIIKPILRKDLMVLSSN